MSIFDNKHFNGEVFGKYLDTVPRIKQNAFLKAGIFNNLPELKTMLDENTGGNYVSLPMVGLIGGDAQNYDGQTTITSTGIDTYLQGIIAHGRAHSWKERDFTQDITGHNFMDEIAKQVGGYWDDDQQLNILAILEGIFSMTAVGDKKFVDAHTLDITEETEKVVNATTLNSAIQKAAGANKNIFSLVIMHSQISTNLENMQLLQYGKGVDANGVEKDLALVTWNGRIVLIDDDVPFDEETGAYTTYILGRGALDYCDIGVTVPNETTRDPLTNGGENILVTRRRRAIAPRGISFKKSTSIISPMPTDFKTATNWTLVESTTGTKIDHKAIPIARIKSLG